jgi:HSP20 family molecular chaperone IbpA
LALGPNEASNCNYDSKTKTTDEDVADLEDRYEMSLEMPGILKDDINIEVTSNTIEISAKHGENKDD